MLVFVPTREDVLGLQSIDQAFDLSTQRIQFWEVALIRVALAEGLLVFSRHAEDEAEEEHIARNQVASVIRSGKAASKDVDDDGPRQVGINFEGMISRRRRIRVKVSWDRRHYTATVHTI